MPMVLGSGAVLTAWGRNERPAPEDLRVSQEWELVQTEPLRPLR